MDLSQTINKYNLPSKEVLEAELGTLNFEEKDDIIIELTKSLREKTSKYIQFLEDILQPDSSFIIMQESSSFSDSDRNKILPVFKKLILLQRTNLLVQLDGSKEDKVTYFKQLFTGWQDLKKNLKPFIQKALITWSDEESFEEIKQNYFG
jgi:transcription termination factor NusB